MRALGITALVALGLVSAFIAPRPAFAQTTCDPDFLDVMEARAWMTSNREMEAAQKLIMKPDSVLEYSCFNSRLTRVATQATFVNAGGGINDIVRTPQVEYLQNFSHTLGGGAAPGSPIGNTCNAMYAIWDLLKCDNFNKADFQTFAELGATDRRTLPDVCPSAAARNNMWTTALAAAFPAPALPAANGGMDQVETLLGFLDPNDCDALDPIPTGMTVMGWDLGTTPATRISWPDYICSAPGCYYDYNDDECE